MAGTSGSLRRSEATPQPSIRLRVGRARSTDIGTGAARLGLGAFRRLGLSVGDVIELAGKRRTAVIALRLQFEDRGLDVIRLEGLVRANAGAVIGDEVEVRRVSAPAGRHVALAYAVAEVSGTAREREAADAIQIGLVGRVVTAGDVIAVPMPRRDFADPTSSSAAASAVRGEHAGLAAVEVQCRVLGTQPEGSVRILAATQIELVADVAESTRVARAGATYDDVGGLADAIAQLRETVELPLARPDLFRQLGINPPRGVLLHGPNGSGKTLLASAVAGETGARLFLVDGSRLADEAQATGLEQELAELFQRTAAQAPVIILLDGLDS